MFAATIDEIMAFLEVARERTGGQTPVRIVMPHEETALPFLVNGHLKKEGTQSPRKTAQFCVFISIGEIV